MPEVEGSAGTIEYEDTGGSGPAIVFVHGLIMDGSLWRHVVADLRRDYRCILPTLPFGAHRRLAELLPHGRLVEIADSYTLIPEDQPAALVMHMREFLAPARPTA